MAPMTSYVERGNIGENAFPPAQVFSAPLVAFMLALCLGLPYAAAQINAARSEERSVSLENSVKAAFIYKFLAYAEWPSHAFKSANAPIAIGVAGSEEVAAELNRIVAGRTVNNRPITVRQLSGNDMPADVHALFVGAGQSAQLGNLLKKAQQQSMLSVTEDEGALARGSIINFKQVDGRIRFDVSLEAADKSGLKLSSRLLGVAHQVHKVAQ